MGQYATKYSNSSVKKIVTPTEQPTPSVTLIDIDTPCNPLPAISHTITDTAGQQQARTTLIDIAYDHTIWHPLYPLYLAHKETRVSVVNV